ncbi:MAG: S41 family peptidase [Candidatus Paceibacterota bacterium]|jgi:carboxyl-terminal processing protease
MKFPKLSDEVKKNLFFLLGAIVVVLVIGGSYYTGFTNGSSQTKNIIVEGVIDPQKGNATDFSTFWETWGIIKSKYVSAEKTENNQNFLYGAISGLVDSLGDPNSTFFQPKDAKKFSDEISGEFGGIGAEIGMNKDKQLVVIAPLKGTPAEKAGLKPQDYIIKINDEITANLSVDEAVKKIRGPKGTTVKLTIFRDGWTEEKVFEIARDVIQIPTLDFEMLDGKIAYIALHNFYEKAPSLFYQAALKTIAENSEGMIIDLRNNPGGYLEAAVNIAGWFVEKGQIVVTEEFRDKSKNEVFTSRGPSLLKNIPVVVLINKGSASASEILAGALKENNGAIIAGETSFGKGTVQELIGLSDDSMVKITIAHWLTPKGNIIDKNGITPDVKIKTPEEEKNEDLYWIKEAVKLLKK